jgi:competence ComEA-like helix-hairpin-helix protein
MQKLNFFICNNYISEPKLLRLTILAIYFSFCLACVTSQKQTTFADKKPFEVSENALNINFATAEELEKLPQIGKGLADKIIKYREKYGNFRHPEHLILVKGMSDNKFRAIQNMVKVE